MRRGTETPENIHCTCTREHPYNNINKQLWFLFGGVHPVLSSKKNIYSIYCTCTRVVSCVVVLCCTALLCCLIHNVLYMYMYLLIELLRYEVYMYIKYTLCVQTCRCICTMYIHVYMCCMYCTSLVLSRGPSIRAGS